MGRIGTPIKASHCRPMYGARACSSRNAWGAVLRPIALCHDTAYPNRIEIAVLLAGEALRVEQFDNRPGELSAGPQV
jgi:hypothetical protein